MPRLDPPFSIAHSPVQSSQRGDDVSPGNREVVLTAVAGPTSKLQHQPKHRVRVAHEPDEVLVACRVLLQVWLVQNRVMANFIPFNRDQYYLFPPDLKRSLPDDDLAHFVIAAVDRVELSRFLVKARLGGKPQYHPRMMLALLIYSYADGLFSSRRIERASYRDIGVRFVAANLHPDHDTIAVFRRTNKTAFEAAFLQVLLPARESGLLRVGTVSIDGTKIDANASKIRSVRYDRAEELRAKLAAHITVLTARAEAANAEADDPQALPDEIARRETLKARLDAACARLEAQARTEADAARPA